MYFFTDENRAQNIAATTHTNSSNDTTTTTINSSSGTNTSNTHQSFSNDILRRPLNVVEQQPLTAAATSPNVTNASSTSTTLYQPSNDSAYVNTEYTNRETLLCDAHFEKQQLVNVASANLTAAANASPTAQTGSSALYLNTAVFQDSARLSVSLNGVVRKIPENLVLNNTPLPESQQHSVQPSPALSTASGPYIPISECYSGSPKFMVIIFCLREQFKIYLYCFVTYFQLDSDNPSTPLNNLDPKFYDTPRSHNNIGLNLTNDQSYSPKITNCGTVNFYKYLCLSSQNFMTFFLFFKQQLINVSKNRCQKSDSDSESVFTDDEWTHPMPLRENMGMY